MRLEELKGLGEKRLALLLQYHIRTPEDLLYFFPLDYVDNSVLVPPEQWEEGKTFSVKLQIVSGPSFFYARKGMSVLTFYGITAAGRKVALRWYNQPYRASAICTGAEYIFSGRAHKPARGAASLMNPSVYEELTGIVPVYPRIKGLPGKLIRGWINEVLTELPPQETLPEEVLSYNGFPPLRQALREIHFPASSATLQAALKRLQFEKALLYFLFLGDMRKSSRIATGISFKTDGLLEKFIDTLSFSLTDGQKNAMRDIAADMAASFPMNRLIQGDVGCGKTVVAEFAAYVAFQSDRQCVFLAPTDLLARQQYKDLGKRFKDACGFLSGRLDAKERRAALQKIKDGSWKVIVGTHALFSEDVIYHNLGLVIADEQHRFGVAQRARITRKGTNPDLLVMSATPIPRTLALLLYGDLSVSIIKDMPANRLPVKTHLVGRAKRTDMYRYLAGEALAGRRSYVVCPLIESAENSDIPAAEDVYTELTALMPETKIGLLHGRMKEQEKSDIMLQFKTGSISILVSTTVIEVGIHVPEAAHIVIEGADYFGLSSLHQLRGRVGRGMLQGHCYLSVSEPKANALERLKILLQSSDGFEVAEKDMQLRGTGDIFGLQQSGTGEATRLLQACEEDIIKAASAAAKNMLEHMKPQYLELLQRAGELYRQGDVVFN